jgi:uncharacterized protein with HEPN domain
MSAAELLSRLEDILEAIAEIEAFIGEKTFDDYMAEPLLRRGVERDIEIISEASRHIPKSLKSRYPLIPWRKVAGIGNVLRHGYKNVDDHEMWDNASTDLAPLKTSIQSMMLEVGSEPDGNHGR